jgi:hypothetical protein
MGRRRKGQYLVEFTVVSAAFVPIFMLFADSYSIFSALHLNETACRNAARIAASGEPRLVLARAYQTVEDASANLNGETSITLVSAGTTVSKPQLDKLCPFGGQTMGTVTVTTAVKTKLLLLGWFLGPQRELRLLKTIAVPSTYIVPNALQRSSGSNNMA